MDIEEYNNYIENNRIMMFYFYGDEFNNLNSKIKTFENENNYNLIWINYKNNSDLIETLFIKSVPLFRIYKNNKFIEEIFGNYGNIKDILKNHI